MSEITYKTGWIKDSEGNKFAPITTTDQVITSNGADLASEINNIKNDVTTLNSKFVFIEDATPSETVLANNWSNTWVFSEVPKSSKPQFFNIYNRSNGAIGTLVAWNDNTIRADIDINMNSLYYISGVVTC